MEDLTQPNRGPAGLRELLAGKRLTLPRGLTTPCLAWLIEQAGFDAVYMTGYGASGSPLGRPGRRPSLVWLR